MILPLTTTAQVEIDELKARCEPYIADFIQDLAEWGWYAYENGILWEAMVSVVEAYEKGDFDDVLRVIE